jgi:hypothetical protein
MCSADTGQYDTQCPHRLHGGAWGDMTGKPVSLFMMMTEDMHTVLHTPQEMQISSCIDTGWSLYGDGFIFCLHSGLYLKCIICPGYGFL